MRDDGWNGMASACEIVMVSSTFGILSDLASVEFMRFGSLRLASYSGVSVTFWAR